MEISKKLALSYSTIRYYLHSLILNNKIIIVKTKKNHLLFINNGRKRLLLSEKQTKIMDFIKLHGPVSQKKIMTSLSIPQSSLSKYLLTLESSSLINSFYQKKTNSNIEIKLYISLVNNIGDDNNVKP
jgi:predicted transcriptional regulator